MIRGSSCSPLQAKAKRRQSDAKWRASVATCYGALKYVVPNVKNMIKRKISKALILQESERHIKELEEAVNHLLEIESKKRGKAVLWKEGPQWSHCTLNKLRADFSEKQQRVFHMHPHGRRCYNLLQDIKEDVFAMEADPGQLAVLQEAPQAASSSTSEASTVSPYLKVGEKEMTPNSKPTCRLSLVLSGFENSSVQHNERSYIKQMLNKTEGQKLKFHFENVNGDLYIVPDPNSSIPHLVNLPPLEARNEQEVPSMKLPLKPPPESKEDKANTDGDSPKKKSPALKDVDKALNCNKAVVEGMAAIQAKPKTYSLQIPDSPVQEKKKDTPSRRPVGIYTISVSSASEDGTVTANRQGHSSPNITQVKEEINTPRNSQDPLLSSLAAPRYDEMTPLFVRDENNIIFRRRPRLGTARKKLNFGQCHSTTQEKQAGTGASRTPSSTGGFTPVKLPDEFGMIPDVDGSSLGCLISPWKIINSPSFEPRITPQNYLDSTSLPDPYDSLMCLETIDAMNFDDDCDGDIRRETKTSKEKDTVFEENCKRKISDHSPEAGMRSKPKCCKKLDSFYDGLNVIHGNDYVGSERDTESFVDNSDLVPDICMSSREEEGNLHDETYTNEESYFGDDNESLQNSKREPRFTSHKKDSHVVPNIDTLETSSKDHAHILCQGQGKSIMADDAFNTGSDCNDFDGFYFYYRHMSQLLRQKGTKTSTSIRSCEVPCSSSLHNQPTKVVSPMFSSPSVAAKVAHMWSSLSLKDRLTMAEMAKLEDRQVQRDSQSQYTDSELHKFPALVLDSPHNGSYQKCNFVSEDNQEFRFVWQRKSHENNQLSRHGKDNSGRFLGTPQNCETENDYGIGGEVENRHSFLEDSQHNLTYSLPDGISPFKGFSGMDNYTNLYSCHRKEKDVERALRSCPHNSGLYSSPLVLGGLSQDLQEVEVQPLGDHTYGHSFSVE